MGALALATSSPTEALLNRLPHSRHDKIINRNMWKHILVQGTFQIILLMILIFAGENILPEDTAAAVSPYAKKDKNDNFYVLKNSQNPNYVAAGRPYELGGDPL